MSRSYPPALCPLTTLCNLPQLVNCSHPTPPLLTISTSPRLCPTAVDLHLPPPPGDQTACRPMVPCDIRGTLQSTPRQCFELYPGTLDDRITRGRPGG
eukprot:758876-Hanusia_phi.AAC.3